MSNCSGRYITDLASITKAKISSAVVVLCIEEVADKLNESDRVLTVISGDHALEPCVNFLYTEAPMDKYEKRSVIALDAADFSQWL